MGSSTSTEYGVLTAGFAHRTRIREWLFEHNVKFNESRRFFHSKFYVQMTKGQQTDFLFDFANVLKN